MVRKTVEEKIGEVQKVVMYSRIGYSEGSEQDELRFSQQEDAMQKFCAQQNLEVKSKYREVAVGTLDHWSRPVLEKALDELKWSRYEKSVLLVSRLDRLTKNFGNIVKLLANNNPKFLVAASGMRYDPFVFTIQAASAEEEFRFKYGKLHHTTPQGLQTFYNRHKFFIELMSKNGSTKEDLANKNMWDFIPHPAELQWDVATIDNILKYGEDK